MKYIIDVPEDRVNNGKLSLFAEVESPLSTRIQTGIKCEPYTEPDRKAIEDDVWELADYMCKMSQTERCLCFGFSYSSEVYMNLTCQEAKAKFEAWLKEDEIHVGDEVVHKDYPTCKAVVTKLYQSGYLCAEVLFPDGMTDKEIIVSNLIKTGRHLDEVAELLEKMRGEE